MRFHHRHFILSDSDPHVLTDQAYNSYPDWELYEGGSTFTVFETVLFDSCDLQFNYWMAPDSVLGKGFVINRGNSKPVTRISLKNAQGLDANRCSYFFTMKQKHFLIALLIGEPRTLQYPLLTLKGPFPLP